MEGELKILILEDVPTDADLMERELKKGKLSYESKLVETKEDFVCQLEEFDPDLILSDYSLPQFTGMEALKLAKKKSLNLPFIIVTGSMNEDVAVECMKAGAWDYVTKQHLLRLAPAVKSAVERKIILELKMSAEVQILQAKNDWESTFNAMPDMITIQDTEFNILRSNSAATQIIDFKMLDSSKLTKCYRQFHGANKPLENCPGRKSLETGKPEVIEMFEPRLNKHLEIRIIPMLDSKGVPERLIHLTRDITELNKTKQSLVRSNEDLETLFLSLVAALVSALDAKSPWTKGHSERVANYAERIAKEMGFKDEDLKKIRLAGLLHDIGKIGTYDEVLEKPGRLTKEEFDMVKQHPSQGATILEGIKQLQEIVPIVRHHHERIDGKGYPDGIKGEDLPMQARIMHIADSYDSMTSDRPYRKSPGKDFAVSEFVKYSGVQFDAGVVKAFIKVLGVDGDYEKANKCQT